MPPSSPAPSIFDHPLPYVDLLESRDLGQVDLVVIHCTELPGLADARQAGEQVRYPSGTGNSGHYYIDRGGRIEVHVPPDRVAHHVHGHNQRSIGIELVNRGRYPHWLHSAHQSMGETYPEAQMRALEELLAWLVVRVPGLRFIEGHDRLDTRLEPASDDGTLQVQRRLDPGPLFPWKRVLAATTLRRLAPIT